MSIATELKRISNGKNNLKLAINSKTDSSHQITNETIDAYSEFVNSIQTGGGADLTEYYNMTPSASELTDVKYWVNKNYIKKMPTLTVPDSITDISYLCATSFSEVMYDVPKIICNSNVTNTSYLYYDNYADTIDVSGLNMSNVTKIRNMFNNCAKLKSIDTSNWDLSSLSQSSGDITRVFYGCTLLEKAVITPKINVSLYQWFYYCYSLKTLVLLKNDGVCTFASTLNDCSHMNGTVNATYNPEGLKDGRIYVPDNLVSNYKTSAGWITYADQILPLSQLPEEV